MVKTFFSSKFYVPHLFFQVKRACIKMSEFYQVVKIDGKGFGCVATKDIKRGTLILKEKGQVFDNGSKSVTEDKRSFKE